MSNYDRFVETHKIALVILSRPVLERRIEVLRRKDPDGSPHMGSLADPSRSSKRERDRD